LELYTEMQVVKPIPIQGSFGRNEYDSDFLFIVKEFE